MKLCKVSALKGGEVLAKAIITSDYKVLLSDGSVIRPEYIDKIQELGITEVYIKSDDAREEAVLLLKSDLESTFHEKVKRIIEKHTYNSNQELVELSVTADNIISNILEEDEIVERIYDIKERSSDIYEHSISICSLATLTALRMKVDKPKVHDIAVGCLLHDLGLRYLTISYTDQDINQLSNAELAEYKKHPIYGYSVLKNETWLSDLSKNIVLYHHERIDGSGFPLRTKNISFEAKIVAICDAFDEMICGIGCERQKVYQAVEYLKTFKGVQFDEKAVDTFLEFTAVYPAGSEVLLGDGSVARVIRQNKEFPDRPVLQMIKEKNGQDILKECNIDLIKTNNIFIEKVLE